MDINAIMLALIASAAGVLIKGFFDLINDGKNRRAMQVELQDKLLERAGKMVNIEGLRVDQALARAQAAEESAEEVRSELLELKQSFDLYRERKDREQRRLVRNLNEVYIWIEEGAKPPPPPRPDWLERI